jgi:hypothetical protein
MPEALLGLGEAIGGESEKLAVGNHLISRDERTE